MKRAMTTDLFARTAHPGPRTPDERAALEADVLARLRALPRDGLRLVAPIVYASGRRT